MENNKLKIFTLSSGSSGNSVYISCRGTEILIDAGISARAADSALQSLGSSLSRISDIFITHEHSDHIAGLVSISKRFSATIHMTEDSYSCAGLSGAVPRRFMLHSPLYTQSCGCLEISSFVTPHDSAMSVGYIIDSPCGSTAIATDMGYMTRGVYEHICRCKYVLLESNYDEEMLACGPYPAHLKRRIASSRGHLSNGDCAETVRHLAADGAERIMLCHLSRENNSPEKALERSERALAESGIEKPPVLLVARRCDITEFI